MAINADHHTDNESDVSEQFNDILNSSEQDESVDVSNELDYLRQITEKVRELPQPEMPVADKAALRAVLLKEFRKQHAKSDPAPVIALAPVPAPMPTLMRKSNRWYAGGSTLRLIVAACLILAFVFGDSALRISAASIPGEPFYALKRLTEHVSLAFASGDARTQKISELLQTRLSEVQTLLTRGQMINEHVVIDTMASLKAALQVETDTLKREQLMGQTALVFTAAQTQGKLNQSTLLVALNIVGVSPVEFFAAAQPSPTPTLTSTSTPTNVVGEQPLVPSSMTPTAVPSEMQTNTEMATNTQTPMLSSTLTVSATETQIFIRTPQPTSTPRVTRTPKPANTKRPANTPKPPNENKPDNPGGGKPEDAGGDKGGKK